MSKRSSVKPANKGNNPAYKNSDLSPEKRVKDLLARMTLEEKAAQMMCVWQEKATKLVDAQGNFDFEKAKAAFKSGHGIGQVGRPSDAGSNAATPANGRTARGMAELTNAIQKFFLENTRLGIPVIFHEECLHGHAAKDATSFSQPIGLGATFNPQLVEELFTMTAYEARIRGTHQALTPVVDVARDPRWGRVEETYGEDPYLIARLGCAAVRGFQGDATFKDKKRVIATMKHFVAHGQPEGGMNCAPANVSMRVLRETFLSTFKETIQKAGAISVMASYNEVDGVPSHANKWLLRDVLRKEWGFKGFVVSDYYSIWELNDRPDTHGHFVAKDKAEACALSVLAGVNIELPEPDCYLHLLELVRKGVLKESHLDDLVAPMLLWKFKMGLFDDPYVDPDEADRIVGCDAHRKLALRAAHETITLLKNENSLAPLNPAKFKTIAVIGPNANRSLQGGYSGTPKHDVTVLDGIKAKVGDRVKVLYSEGCKITQDGGSWQRDEVYSSDPDEDRKQIAEAVKIAKQADVIVLAIGGNEQTSREAWNLKHMGDRTSLDLIGRQDELVKAMLATGKPVIVLLFNGRPLSINYVSQNVPVIFECWYLGQECGHAVADVLFGDVNPGGKLPITIPRSAGHLPVFYNFKPSARRGYLFDDVTPLYPFGFGLSYTTFAIKNVRLKNNKISCDGSTQVLVDVTNTGRREGTEVVQMYIRDRVSSVTRPVKELKGFKKVSLKSGGTKTVALDITPESLAFYDINMEYVVEPGDFEIMVGNSSRDADLQKGNFDGDEVNHTTHTDMAEQSEKHFHQKLSFFEKAGYSAADSAANFVFMTMILFQTNFYTDVFGLTAGAAAAILLWPRLWDAFFDPIMGILADRTKTRWGKFRPWILWTAVPWAVVMVLAYTTPKGWSMGALIAYAAITNTMLMTLYSMNNMPYSALGGVMTGDLVERTRLNSFRFVAVNIAQFIVGGCTLPLVAKFAVGHDRQYGWQMTMAIWAVLCLVLFLITFMTTRERIQPPPQQKTSAKEDFAALLKNNPWKVMFVMTLVHFAILSFRGGALYNYYHHYADKAAMFDWVQKLGLTETAGAPTGGILETLGYIVHGDRSDLANSNVADVFNSIINMIGTGVTIIVILLSPPLSKRFGKKAVAVVGFGLAALGTFAFYLLKPTNTGGMVAITVLVAICYAPTIPLVWAIFADVADYSEWKTGRRFTGMVFATIGFALKSGLALGSASFLWIMSWFFSYDTKLPDAPEAVAGFRACSGIVVGILFTICTVLLIAYQLNKHVTIQMADELAERRKKSAAA